MSRTEYRVMKKLESGTEIPAGQEGWIPEKEVAEKLKAYWINQYKEWGFKSREVFLESRETDEPDNRVPMETYNGKPVYNWDHVYWEIMEPGSYVNREIADHMLNVLPPAYWTRNVIQLGEPYDHRPLPDDPEKYAPTYDTFVRVTDEVWEYRGHCFKGKTEESAKKVPCSWIKSA